jgi:uncharacterized LabA/DUF88 family protein
MGHEIAAVFLDGGYIDKILEYNFKKTKINYETFSDILCGSCERFRSYYYYCMPYRDSPSTSEQTRRYSTHQKFINALNRCKRFELRQGKLQKFINERGQIDFRQKRVDGMLAVDIARLAWKGKISHAILVAGDSDYTPAVQDAKDADVLVNLVYHPSSFHDELYDACDERVEITQDLINKSRLIKQEVTV